MILLITEFDVFVDAKRYYAKNKHGSMMSLPDVHSTPGNGTRTPEGTETEDDAEEIPEDLEHLTPDQQQRRIKMRAVWMMGFGTFLVLFFSDPAVEVLTEISKRANVNPFFVSFLLAPLASNASEVIAAYSYSLRKTRKTMGVAFTTLEGAAVMNNTYCLAIFLGIVYFRNLQWTFTAEVVSILFVEFSVGYLASRRRTYRLVDGLLILSMYPASLLLVEGLKILGIQ
jgi:Ca2+/H+ antiporter